MFINIDMFNEVCISGKFIIICDIFFISLVIGEYDVVILCV